MTRAQSLKQETALNSITPERAGGIMYDTAALLNQQQLQGTNPLLISKIYASIEAMEADDNPVSDITGEALKPGQIVVISSAQPDEPDEGLVYRFNGIVEEVSSWTCVGKIGSSPYLEGYQFMGKAVLTPTPTDPGVPTQKVFYQAIEPGTYTNFGGIVVADGEVVNLKWDGTAWSKEAVVGLLKVVPDSVNGGYRLVLVGLDVAHVAEQADLQAVQNALADADFTTLTPVVITGKVVDDDGIVGSGSYDVWVFPVTPGMNYVFRGVLAQGIDRRLVYYSSDAEAADIVGWDRYKGDSETTVSQHFSGPLTIANGANYILLNVRNLEVYANSYEVREIARGPLIRVRDILPKKDEINGGYTIERPDGEVAHLAQQDGAMDASNALVNDDFQTLVPSVISGKVVGDSGIVSSGSYDIWVYPITSGLNYVVNGVLGAGVDRRLVYYSSDNAGANIVGWDRFKGEAATTATQVFSGSLIIPSGANYILLNVRNLPVYSSRDSIQSIARTPLIKVNDLIKMHGLKVVVRADKSFYVRYKMDETHDGILLFDYYTEYNYNKNCIMASSFYVGAPTDTDRQILLSTAAQDCHDCQAPMSTENFGPMFSNHGYSTPRVKIQNNPLTDADLGTEWIDQSGYHYTIGHISPNYVYLLPVIDTSGGPGHETREWRSFSSTYPTQITRNVEGGETLVVESSGRWDYQLGELRNVRVLINGAPVNEGTYYCDEVGLSYQQIGYNPIEVSQWWPTPVYGGIMLWFERNFSITGGNGFLSVTSNTLINNNYPFVLSTFLGVMPMFSLQFGDYVPYIFVPKVKKHNEVIDFREEFAAPSDTAPVIPILRNSTDLYDTDDMPERAYCYLKDGLGNILFGCAGGQSLVRGMSIKSIRNQHIASGMRAGRWSPTSGNKMYTNVLSVIDEPDNILPASFIGESEGYMCWYMPKDDVHVFYHKTKEGYVVYIHTNKTKAKGEAILPDFMNNMQVVQVVEKTAGIELLTETVTDGKLFFSADNSEIEYNYVVFVVR